MVCVWVCGYPYPYGGVRFPKGVSEQARYSGVRFPTGVSEQARIHVSYGYIRNGMYGVPYDSILHTCKTADVRSEVKRSGVWSSSDK